MSLRHHEIAEANRRILNPFTAEKLALLGEICRLTSYLAQPNDAAARQSA
ncbi:MAG TPA: hypothetical protein VFN74_17850 [Chloroflexota bacterium]|nr:hypothetical protein [Chloroflexota bacterium]